MEKLIAKNINWDITTEELKEKVEGMDPKELKKALKGIDERLDFEKMSIEERIDYVYDYFGHNHHSVLNEFFNLPNEVEIPATVVYYSLNEDEKTAKGDIECYLQDEYGYFVNSFEAEGLYELVWEVGQNYRIAADSKKDFLNKIHEACYDLGYECRDLFNDYLNVLTSTPKEDKDALWKDYLFFFDYKTEMPYNEKSNFKGALESTIKEFMLSTDCFNEAIDETEIPDMDAFYEGMIEGIIDNIKVPRDILVQNLKKDDKGIETIKMPKTTREENGKSLT